MESQKEQLKRAFDADQKQLNKLLIKIIIIAVTLVIINVIFAVIAVCDLLWWDKKVYTVVGTIGVVFTLSISTPLQLISLWHELLKLSKNTEEEEL